jgi:hypothetical protein
VEGTVAKKWGTQTSKGSKGGDTQSQLHVGVVQLLHFQGWGGFLFWGGKDVGLALAGKQDVPKVPKSSHACSFPHFILLEMVLVACDRKPCVVGCGAHGQTSVGLYRPLFYLCTLIYPSIVAAELPLRREGQRGAV